MAENTEDVVSRQQTLQRALSPPSLTVEALRLMLLDDEINSGAFKKPMLDPETGKYVLVTDPDYAVIDKVNTLINSPLPRTSYLTPKQAKSEEIKLELLMLKLRNSHRRKGRGFGPIIDALEMHCGSIIRDQQEGHRGKLVTEHRVIANVQSRSKKKSRWGGIFKR